jgi:hypothetical protein
MSLSLVCHDADYGFLSMSNLSLPSSMPGIMLSLVGINLISRRYSMIIIIIQNDCRYECVHLKIFMFAFRDAGWIMHLPAIFRKQQ